MFTPYCHSDLGYKRRQPPNHPNSALCTKKSVHLNLRVYRASNARTHGSYILCSTTRKKHSAFVGSPVRKVSFT